MAEHSEPQQDALVPYRNYLHHVMGCAACAHPPVLCPIGRGLKSFYREARRANADGLEGDGPGSAVHGDTGSAEPAAAASSDTSSMPLPVALQHRSPCPVARQEPRPR